VSVKLVIERSGAVASTEALGSDMPLKSDMPDHDVIACVVRRVGELSFPRLDHGPMTLVFPFVFEPRDEDARHKARGKK
jgi:hypothetical protein